MSTLTPARTYNQNHIPRKYTSGKRRLSIYWTWSYPWESQRDPAAMENRFSTMSEVRTVLWPEYETPEWSAAQFLQGIAGTLELFHRSTLSFQQIAGEATGHPVAVFQRIDQAGYKLPIDERILADADTLLVFGLDHLLSEQEAAPEEIAAMLRIGALTTATRCGGPATPGRRQFQTVGDFSICRRPRFIGGGGASFAALSFFPNKVSEIAPRNTPKNVSMPPSAIFICSGPNPFNSTYRA